MRKILILVLAMALFAACTKAEETAPAAPEASASPAAEASPAAPPAEASPMASPAH